MTDSVSSPRNPGADAEEPVADRIAAYEYRIVSCDGVGYPSPTRDPARCLLRSEQLDKTRPERAPHRVERRPIGEWEGFWKVIT